ncbi:hypothetical protein WJ54_34390 [Burkholderia ubonensis]|nr:hypothetical protein WJ54_34390 [Burkholderia ubonensis]KWC23334.1 hypothetical protein WL50_01355 [Burkholderia ubonensis]
MPESVLTRTRNGACEWLEHQRSAAKHVLDLAPEFFGAVQKCVAAGEKHGDIGIALKVTEESEDVAKFPSEALC